MQRLRRPALASLLFAAVLALAAHAEEIAPPAPGTVKPGQPLAPLGTKNAVVLGLIEGVTEFLPISSTGHLVIGTHVLGLESEVPLKNAAGEQLWYKKPSPRHPEGEPLTVKLAADTYTVIIQVGAILAVLLLYWRQVVTMIVGVLGRSATGFRLLRNVILAFIPVVVIGLAVHDTIDQHFFSIPVVIAAQVIGAIIMLWAEHWRRRNSSVGFAKGEPADLTPKKSLGIGFAQCLALFPGMSRSMVTIVAGYLAGLNPGKAAEFSFLVGLLTLSGAAVYKGAQSGAAMVQVFGLWDVVLGTVVAAVAAFIAVKFLVHFITRHGLALFAYYRLALAFGLVLYFYAFAK